MINNVEAREQFVNSNKPLIRELTSEVYDREPIYVFGVLDEETNISLSFKTFHFNACPAGKSHSAPTVIPGMLHDYAQGQGDSFELHATPVAGLAAVKDMFAQHNLAAYGYFWTTNVRPTAKEIADAWDAAKPRLNALVAEGDKLASGTEWERNSISTTHRKAGKILNLDKPWMNASPEMERCLGCGSTYIPGAAFCPGGCVLDEARARSCVLGSLLDRRLAKSVSGLLREPFVRNAERTTMTTISNIDASTRALGYEFHRHAITETDTAVVGDFNTDAGATDEKPGNPYTVEFSKDREWNLREVHEVILRQVARLTPLVEDKGAQADNPEKDRLRAKSIPQPGAAIVDGEPGAIPTGINTETFATPAQGSPD